MTGRDALHVVSRVLRPRGATGRRHPRGTDGAWLLPPPRTGSGVDMNRLAGLAAHWSSQIELVVVRLPASGRSTSTSWNRSSSAKAFRFRNALLVHPCREEPDPSVFTGPSVGVPGRRRPTRQRSSPKPWDAWLIKRRGVAHTRARTSRTQARDREPCACWEAAHHRPNRVCADDGAAQNEVQHSTTRKEIPMATTKDYRIGEFTFPRGWFMIAEASELDTHRPLAVRFFGKDFALYRGRATGKVVLLDAYCPHMKTHLAAPNKTSYVIQDGMGTNVEGDGIRCPTTPGASGPTASATTFPTTRARSRRRPASRAGRWWKAWCGVRLARPRGRRARVGPPQPAAMGRPGLGASEVGSPWRAAAAWPGNRGQHLRLRPPEPDPRLDRRASRTRSKATRRSSASAAATARWCRPTA